MVLSKEGVILQNVIECLAELVLHIRGCFNPRLECFLKEYFVTRQEWGKKSQTNQKTKIKSS